MTADEIIETLTLEPHPEGGFYRQTWIAPSGSEERPTGTCIYFLLKSGQKSHWHKVDATEIWHYYAGARLTLWTSETDEGPAESHALGPHMKTGERPQVIVPKDHWQAAETTGDWTLVGCTVSPAFQFESFVLADLTFDITKA